jgi:putative transposase
MRTRQTTYFVTSVTQGRRAIFQTSQNAQILCDVLLHYRGWDKYLLHAFAVMPNHFHALITPGPQMAVEECVRLIKGGSAYRIGKGPIWQRGFNQQGVRDAAGYFAREEYIHRNPEARALKDWAYVSNRMEVPLDPIPLPSGAKAPVFGMCWVRGSKTRACFGTGASHR